MNPVAQPNIRYDDLPCKSEPAYAGVRKHLVRRGLQSAQLLQHVEGGVYGVCCMLNGDDVLFELVITGYAGQGLVECYLVLTEIVKLLVERQIERLASKLVVLNHSRESQ